MRSLASILWNGADGQSVSDVLHIHRQSAYLIGRDRAVADLAIEHPSCSKQHAVIQCTRPLSFCGSIL